MDEVNWDGVVHHADVYDYWVVGNDARRFSCLLYWRIADTACVVRQLDFDGAAWAWSWTYDGGDGGVDSTDWPGELVEAALSRAEPNPLVLTLRCAALRDQVIGLAAEAESVVLAVASNFKRDYWKDESLAALALLHPRLTLRP